METNIEKRLGKYVVTFTHGSQSFQLAYEGTKKECKWMKEALDECFRRAFDDETRKRQFTIPGVVGQSEQLKPLDVEFKDAMNDLTIRNSINKPIKKRF